MRRRWRPDLLQRRRPDGIFTWVVGESDVVQARSITSGPRTGDRTIITSRLAESERVVVNGQYKLRQNAEVTVTSPEPPVAAKQAQAS
jgi:membrane fusion protein, multidrug efflux system